MGLLPFAALVGTAVWRTVAAAVRERVRPTGCWRSSTRRSWTLVSGLAFAPVLECLPNVRIPWRTVLVGGLVTAVVFVNAN